MSHEFDVIIIGVGHNSLTAAGYLGKAGLRTLVLERRHVSGGAAIKPTPVASGGTELPIRGISERQQKPKGHIYQQVTGAPVAQIASL